MAIFPHSLLSATLWTSDALFREQRPFANGSLGHFNGWHVVGYHRGATTSLLLHLSFFRRREHKKPFYRHSRLEARSDCRERTEDKWTNIFVRGGRRVLCPPLLRPNCRRLLSRIFKFRRKCTGCSLKRHFQDFGRCVFFADNFQLLFVLRLPSDSQLRFTFQTLISVF